MAVLPVAVLVALLAAGCAGTGGYGPRASAPSGPPEHRDGWWHGCNSGITAAYSGHPDAFRIHDRYRENDAYRDGYDAGYQACFEHERKYPKMRARSAG